MCWRSRPLYSKKVENYFWNRIWRNYRVYSLAISRVFWRLAMKFRDWNIICRMVSTPFCRLRARIRVDDNGIIIEICVTVHQLFRIVHRWITVWLFTLHSWRARRYAGALRTRGANCGRKSNWPNHLPIPDIHILFPIDFWSNKENDWSNFRTGVNTRATGNYEIHITGI